MTISLNFFFFVLFKIVFFFFLKFLNNYFVILFILSVENVTNNKIFVEKKFKNDCMRDDVEIKLAYFDCVFFILRINVLISF